MRDLLNYQNIKNSRIVLSVIGIGIAMYLTYTKLTSTPIFCKYGECDIVQNSEYSLIFGIPVAIFGIGFYITAAYLAWFKSENPQSKNQKYLDYAHTAWLTWGVLFSIYLTYLELYVIKAICMWCVLSCIVTFLLGLSVLVEKYRLPKLKTI